MKRWFFVFVACLFAGAWLYDLAAHTPGYLLLVVGNVTVELSVWFALVALLLLLTFTYLITTLTRGGLKGASAQMKRLFSGSTRRAQRQMSKGFIHFFEGNWKEAEKLLGKSAERSPTPLLNYLGAARSAYEIGDTQQANDYLQKAEQEAPEAELAVILTQARMLYASNKFEQCAATLERARKMAEHNPVVLDLLSKVYGQLQDWKNLEQLLPELKKYSLKTESSLQQTAEWVYGHLLQNAGSAGSAESLAQAWQRVPKEYRHSPVVMHVYIEQMMAVGAEADVEPLLRKTLRSHWDDSLVLSYGTVQGKDTMSQLLAAESWLKDHPGNAALLLTLGRLSLRNQLWGKARDYFESSLKTKPSAAAYAENARLLARLGEHQLSAEFYQKGLYLAADSLPDLPLPEAKR